MRQVKEFDTTHGKRYRVRYRRGGRESSETFRRKQDATTFAAILDGGGVADALAWLDARDRKATSVTFGQWFETYVDQLTGVTERTKADYRSMHRRYLASLDQLPLSLIARAHVTGIVNEMDTAGRSPKTIKQAVHMLSTCLQLAIDEGELTGKNPCRGVRLPSAQVGGQPRFLTLDEFAALLAATPEHYRPLVTFLFGTGMRWAEATAIHGRHVDLAAGTVRVEQAWKRVPGKGYAIGPPKTERSKRTVNAATLALVAIEPLVRGPNDLLFITRSGGPVHHANFYNNVWTKACIKAGLDPAPRIHDARHSHASWLLSDGIQLEAVQDQLGHESILTTRKIYGHLQPALGVAVGKAASAAMERALAKGAAGAGARALAGPSEPSRD